MAIHQGFGFEKSLLGPELDRLSQIEQPIDYFDFPVYVLSFAQSLAGSSLYERSGCFFRRRKSQLLLLRWDCSNQELLRVLRELSAQFKIKSLNWVHRDSDGLPTKNYMNEYWSDSVDPDTYLSQCSKSIRKSIRQGERRMELDFAPSEEEVWEVFETWLAWAKSRMFMVIQGHYRRFIRMHYELGSDRTFLIGFRDKEADGRMFAVAGGEFFRGCMVNTLLKHEQLPSRLDQLPRYADYVVVRHANDQGVIGRFFNGCTCDEYKQRLPYQWAMSWRIDMTKVVEK